MDLSADPETLQVQHMAKNVLGRVSRISHIGH